MRGSLNTTRIVVVTRTTGNASTNTRVAKLRRTPIAKPHQPRAPATFEELGTAMVEAPNRRVKDNSPTATPMSTASGNLAIWQSGKLAIWQSGNLTRTYQRVRGSLFDCPIAP